MSNVQCFNNILPCSASRSGLHWAQTFKIFSKISNLKMSNKYFLKHNSLCILFYMIKPQAGRQGRDGWTDGGRDGQREGGKK